MASEPNDDAGALESQQALVESSLPLVFQTFDEAVAGGVADPVVILVDCEDELGGEIVRGWLGDEAVDDAILAQRAERSEEGETTVFARALPLAECRKDLTAAFPYLAPVFGALPGDDGVLVVGVTAGGASALTAPHDAR